MTPHNNNPDWFPESNAGPVTVYDGDGNVLRIEPPKRQRPIRGTYYKHVVGRHMSNARMLGIMEGYYDGNRRVPLRRGKQVA